MGRYFSYILTISFLFFSCRDGYSALPDDDSLRVNAGKRPNHYFSLLPALAWNSYKDEINSPLTYRTNGLLLAIELGLENRSKNHNGYTSIFFTNQNMNAVEAAQSGSGPETFLTFKLNTSRCYELATLANHRIHYRLGYNGNFEYNHQINLRLENSAYTFAIWANAGVANRFEFPFVLPANRKIGFIHFHNPEQHFLLAWQLNIPVATVITRPNFAGIRHFANGEFLSNLFREMNDHVQVVSLNKFIMLHSQIELLAPLGNHNRLKIAYAWEGFRYNQEFKRVQGVMGAIEIGVMFKLDSHDVIQ
jgi:hypothetical protein